MDLQTSKENVGETGCFTDLMSSGMNGEREVGELASSRGEGYSLDRSSSNGSKDGCRDLNIVHKKSHIYLQVATSNCVQS